MTVLSLRDWLWQGSFQARGGRLEVWQGVEGQSDGPDLLTGVSDSLKELGRLSDLTREIEKRSSSGSEVELKNVARGLLPALDAIDRLLEFGRNVEEPSEEFLNWLKAVDGVSMRLGRVMESIGLTAMSCVGAEVDLGVHDVVATVRTREYAENTIVEERQKGYYFRGRLLRDAKVVVAVNS